ncbi:Transcription elongation factor spt6 [Malassezia vespertilionis]|nr:Transcription elongation factor spt6 [Malassezia vespertilionis]WFD07743.1 Transcription elongation factor spt6 [Malassezia vespertilionis]
MDADAYSRAAERGEDVPMSEEEGDALMKEDGNVVGLDSSDEDEDDDEEEQRRVAEGFIDDDDDAHSRNVKRKRRSHRHESEDEALDEDDLALLKENTGPDDARLKRLRPQEGQDAHKESLANIFDDEELPSVSDAIRSGYEGGAQGYDDELDDFIEDDEDEELDEELREERRQARREERRAARLSGQRIDPLKVGIDPEAWDEIHDIFGNGEDYAWAIAEDDEEEEESRKSKMEYKDIFEPEQIRERMLTDDDDRIKQVDIPERIQLAIPGEAGLSYLERKMSDAELDDAANWASLRISPRCTAEFVEQGAAHGALRGTWTRCVRQMLAYMLNEFLEVPYLTQHRLDDLELSHFNSETQKHDTITLLLHQELLSLNTLGIKFKLLLVRKQALSHTLAQLRNVLGSIDEETSAYVDELLAQAASFEEVSDINEWLAMRFGEKFRDATAMIEAGQLHGASLFKKPTVVSEYERLVRLPVALLARRMSISPQQLAANVVSGVHAHVPEDESRPPHQVADEFIDAENGIFSAENALALVRTMLAHEIGKEPLLRREVRSLFLSAALLDVEPTERGMTRIDESHLYHNFKFLRAKPVSALLQNPSQFLQIINAEEERLVRVTLRLPTELANRFEARLQDEYVSEGLRDVSQRWNEERRAVVEEANAAFLLPLGRAWMREWLLEECRDALLRHVESRVAARVAGGPYQSAGMQSRNGDPEVEELDHIPRVLAVSDGDGDPRKSEVVAIFLDERARFLERAAYDSLRPPTRAQQAQRDEAMGGNEAAFEDARAAFVDLLKRRRPDVIVVNGFSARTAQLVASVEELAHAAHSEMGGHAHARIDVIRCYDDIARLYQHSARAMQEFPELSTLGRYCIALARYTQSPVNEFAALGADLIAVQFDPAQRLLPSERLRMHMERAIVMAVNDVGVDINDAVNNSYIQHMLPYVAGLGHRKAQALVQAIRAKLQGHVVSRVCLAKHGVLSFAVWNNAASFLRIEQDRAIEARDDQPDVLDATRIHPEDYDFPRQMARDALNKHVEDLEGEHPSVACEEIMQHAHPEEKLAALDLDNYAAMLYEQRGISKRLTLFFCKQELIRPYEDWRMPQALPSMDEIFTMFTGETRRQLSEGYVVPVAVTRIEEGRDMDGFLRVRLGSGIEGTIAGRDIVAGYDPRQVRLRQMFRTGQTLNAVLILLDMYTMRAELSIRPEAFEHVNPAQGRVPVDAMYFDHERAQLASEEAEMRIRRRNRNRIGSRVIDHPNYHNLNALQAQTFLATQPRGAVVIRPSSRGMDHLAATWKVDEGVYQHIDVLELDKENDYALGRILRVADMGSYSDLDDLIVNHVRPMAGMVEMMMNHEKYKGADVQALHTYLTNASLANPTRSVYAFGLDREHPGYFYLAFKANASAPIQQWSVKVLPGAFKLGHATQLADMAALTNAFKTQYTAQASAAARGGRTPAVHGGATPGGRTPGHYGAQTPLLGGATPGRFGGATPGRFGGVTPGYAGPPGPPPAHPGQRW